MFWRRSEEGNGEVDLMRSGLAVDVIGREVVRVVCYRRVALVMMITKSVER